MGKRGPARDTETFYYRANGECFYIHIPGHPGVRAREISAFTRARVRHIVGHDNFRLLAV